MRDYSDPITAYRSARREFWQIDFLSFKVRDKQTGDAVWFHFHSLEADESVEVIDLDSGEEEFRSFFGGGAIVETDLLVRKEGTGIDPVTLTLSATHPAVIDMVYGYNCRDAVVEWRQGEGEDVTGLLVDIPPLEFEGIIDDISREDAAIDPESPDGEQLAQSVFKIAIVDLLSLLSRGNADVRSLEVGQQRNGDMIFANAAETNTWDIDWGEAGGKHRRKSDRKGRDDPQPRDYGWGHG